MTNKAEAFRSLLALLALSLAPSLAFQAEAAEIEGAGEFSIPSWFKLSFLDLREDVAEAKDAGKRLFVFFHQDGCPYCATLVHDGFGNEEIAAFIQKNFDAVDLNMWGSREVTGFDGSTLTESKFAEAQEVLFTPTLLFFDEQGQVALRVNGYYPPERLMASLHYAAEHKEKELSFRDYYAAQAAAQQAGSMRSQSFFRRPPHHLNQLDTDKPLIVFFEQAGKCPGCDELHQEIFTKTATLELLKHFHAVQLDMWSDTTVTTPGGKTTTAKEWAQSLGMTYTPSVVIFDDREEVARIEAFLKAFHVQSILAYIASGAYVSEPSFQRFLKVRAERLRGEGERVDLWK